MQHLQSWSEPKLQPQMTVKKNTRRRLLLKRIFLQTTSKNKYVCAETSKSPPDNMYAS